MIHTSYTSVATLLVSLTKRETTTTRRRRRRRRRRRIRNASSQSWFIRRMTRRESPVWHEWHVDPPPLCLPSRVLYRFLDDTLTRRRFTCPLKMVFSFSVALPLMMMSVIEFEQCLVLKEGNTSHLHDWLTVLIFSSSSFRSWHPPPPSSSLTFIASLSTQEWLLSSHPRNVFQREASSTQVFHSSCVWLTHILFLFVSVSSSSYFLTPRTPEESRNKQPQQDCSHERKSIQIRWHREIQLPYTLEWESRKLFFTQTVMERWVGHVSLSS